MPEASRHSQLRPWLIVVTVLSIAVTYFLLHIIYIPTNSDDAWTTSFTYRFFYHGELRDTVFGRPAGTLIAFGYSYAAMQKLVLDAFGWTRSNAIFFSTCLFFLSLPFWWRISRSLGCSRSASLTYVLLLPLWEPLFRIANTARSDACCLLLVSIALFFAQNRRYVLAGIASGIAFEIHQMGVLSFLLVGIHALFELSARYKAKKKIVLFVAWWAAGVVLGVSYYLFFHFPYLNEILQSAAAMHSWKGNFILAHFFMTNSYRHLPVLIVILLSVALSFRLKLVCSFWEAYILMFSIILFSIVFPRPNIYYSAYFFVFIALIITIVVAQFKKENMFVLVFLVFILPQYGYIYYKNRYFDMSHYTASLKREVPERCDIITGPFNAWFALKNRRFLGNFSDMVSEVKRLTDTRSICYLHRLDKDDSRDVMNTYFSVGPLVKAFEAGGHRYGLYNLSSKAQ